ncbi:MAG: ATP--guanido phosphotransferase [Clostridia bacterium]|nr:ATP--guanido phosphotransferase [Clostridia bacterium]
MGEKRIRAEYESVAVSTRMRLARNFKDYPFPGRLLSDPHAAEQSGEMIRLLSAALAGVEDFTLYEMESIPEETAARLKERYLISRELMRNRKISAALISRDESISVMINEEDHLRVQYFMKGYDLHRAYERIAGIDDIISDSIPFAYDEKLGYLTACPTNLGTGLRASVMLFLPALARRGRMKRIIPTLTRLGLTVRGVFGEGSGAEGDLFQISNEITLGLDEEELLFGVEQAVSIIVETELLERGRMKAEEGIELKDKIFRSYGILSSCCRLKEKEFSARISDLKLGTVLGYMGREGSMSELDQLAIAMRPASIRALAGCELGEEEGAIFRAEYVAKKIKEMGLLS